MSRTLKLVLLVAILEMTLVTVAATAWRWTRLAGADDLPAARNRMLFTAFALALLPAWLGLGSWLVARRMARPGLAMASDTRRYNEITLMAAAAFVVGVQAWEACALLGFLPGDEVGIRMVEALTGIFLMVAGNFAAKTSPPTGERAPEAAAWTRGMLRIGWVGVATGLVIVVSAITVAVDWMVWIILAATSAYVATALWQHWAMHRRPA